MLIGQGPMSHEHSRALSSFINEKYFRKYNDTEYREKHNDDEETKIGALSISECHVFLLPPAAGTHDRLSGTMKVPFQSFQWKIKLTESIMG